MDAQLTPTTSSSLSEVLDRVLDKGVVIEAEIGFEIAGLVLAGAKARIVVTSIETYLEYADIIATAEPIVWCPVGPGLFGFDVDRARRRASSVWSKWAVENRIRDYFGPA